MKILRDFVIYRNSDPLLVSRQALFPGIVQLANDDLLAVFSIGQAFDAADKRAVFSKSHDMGQSWSAPAQLNAHQIGPEEISESVKPVLLADGRVLVTGYGFVHADPLVPVVNPDTFAVLPMVNMASVSVDNGQSWQDFQRFEIEGAPLEMSGPCIQIEGGRILAATTPFQLGEDGHSGWIVYSDDDGKTWHKLSEFFRSPGGAISSWECRLCEMEPGRIAVLFWAYDNKNKRNLPNHMVFSSDGGASFAPAVDTNVLAQASNLIWLGAGNILTIHAHREAPVGLVVRRVNVAGGGFDIRGELDLFDGSDMGSDSSDIRKQFGSLKFGQPSLLLLNNGQILATYWCFENCQHVVKGCILAL